MSASTEPCRSCRKPILWAVTDKGKHIPIDPDPDPAGNIMLQKIGTTTHAGVLSKNQAAAAKGTGVHLYLSHFTSCPHAGNWRKR